MRNVSLWTQHPKSAAKVNVNTVNSSFKPALLGEIWVAKFPS